MRLKCPYCQTDLDLVDLGGRCPRCRAVFEVYYDRADADGVAGTYNQGDIPANPPAKVCQFEDADGWLVFFRDEGRLAKIAEQLL